MAEISTTDMATMANAIEEGKETEVLGFFADRLVCNANCDAPPPVVAADTMCQNPKFLTL